MDTKDTAKTIICFGDSNTWGQMPGTEGRHPRSNRWPNILQKMLGGDYEVISDGLSGRTFAAVDTDRPHRTGTASLKALLISHDPVDLVIIMLGTNEIKSRYNLEAKDIARNLELTIELIRNQAGLEKRPAVLVVCPPAPVSSPGHEI